MDKRCYVITKADLGWDCVCGIYFADSEEDVIAEFTDDIPEEDMDGMSAAEWMEENLYFIHDKYIKQL